MIPSLPPLVLDGSALRAMFDGNLQLVDLLERAERGTVRLLLPTTCIAEAEAAIKAGPNGWEAILLTRNVTPLDLTCHAAVEIGQGDGDLEVRHAAHEAAAASGAVVTTYGWRYQHQDVQLLVV